MKVWVAAEIDLAAPGGPLEHLAGLWNAMRRRGHDVALTIPPPCGAPARELEFSVISPALGVGPRQLAFQFALWRRWRALLKAGERPDCIYVRGGQWLLAPALFASRHSIPLCVEINGIVVRQLRARGLPAPFIRMADQIEFEVCRRAAATLAISPSVAKMLAHTYGLAESRVHCVPTGVGCDEFRPAASDEERAAARDCFGIGPGVCIGYVGTFDWWQGLPNLLLALAQLQRTAQGDAWSAVLAGYGAGEADLRRLAAELNLAERVRFIGRLAPVDVPAFLRALDIGVLPRDDYAPTPTKLLQYFATGLASAYPALPDLHWLGEAGLCYAPGGLAGALAALCGDAALRQRLGRRSLELCRASLGWPAVAAKVEALLESMGGRSA